MKKHRIELAWPRRGISEDRAFGDQPPGTTPFAKNVRTLDRISQRAQGAQRPGYRDFTTRALVAGKNVDALASVSVDLSKIQYAGPGNSQIKRIWGHTVPGFREAVAVSVDQDGNIYVVDAAGNFQRLGADGKVSATTTFYVPGQEAVVPRILADRSGNVYVATSHPNGFTGRVLKFSRVDIGEGEDEESAFVKEWEYSGLFGVRDFDVRGGSLAVARFFSEQVESGAPSDVTVLGALFAPSPVEFYSAATPSPVSSIRLNDQGEVLGCSPANQSRNSILGDEGWSTPVESWNLHELEDATGFGASTRLHLWWDVKTLQNTLIDGAFVESIPDRRWLQSSLDFADTLDINEDEGALSGGGGSVYVPPTDLVARRIARMPFYDRLTHIEGKTDSVRTVVPKSITYRSKGAGTSPAVKFPGANGDALMCSLQKAGSGTKSDTDNSGFPSADGVMPQQASLIPSYEKAVFATFFVIRYNFREDRSEMVWSHPSRDGTQYAIYMNADKDTSYKFDGVNGLGVARGQLTLHVGQNGKPFAADSAGVGTGHRVLSCDLTSADFDNPQNVAIICIQHAGSINAGLTGSRTGHSLFRVNGRTVGRFSMIEGLSPLQSAMEMFGGSYSITPVYNAGRLLETWTVDNYASPGHGGPWRGSLMEAFTVLGGTALSNEANEVMVSAPNRTVGVPANPGVLEQYTDMSGVSYFASPPDYTKQATEIERIEGYLAHRWGCPNVLDDTTPGAPVEGLVAGHPFGGVRVPVGSPNAGSFVISKAGLALLSPKELLFKVGASGNVVWAVSGGGHGLGVQTGSDGAVMAVGRHEEGSQVVAKRVRDLGKDVRTTGEDTWELSEAENLAPVRVPGLAVDGAANLYWPRFPDRASARLHFKGLITPPFHPIKTIYPPGTDPLPETTYFIVTAFGGSGGSNLEVLEGGTLLSSATNLVAAINNTGIDSGAAKQYDPRPRNPYFTASLEVNGSQVYVKFIRRALPGLARISHIDLTPFPIFEWTDLAASIDYSDPVNLNEIAMGLDSSNRRVEMRGAKDGALQWVEPYASGILGDDDTTPFGVALDSALPLYPEDSDLKGVPEFVYVSQRNNVDSEGVSKADPTGDNLRKLRQVERRQVIGVNKSPRRTVHVATCDGNLYIVERGKAPRMVNNGLGVFNPASPFTKLFSYREKIYGLDGQTYIKFNPKTSLVEPWEAEGAGKIPYGAKLGVVFNGRIALARTADDPHNLHLSERGNPDGWDTDPAVITPLTAFSGASTGNLHFRKSDLVNCLIPARDDLLIIGGDQSISRLSGDPGTGGQLDNISTGEGLAFGSPYAIGPAGTVFVKTINGGVLRIGSDGSLDRISLGFIEHRLQQIDLAEYDVRMAWNFEQEGLHILQVPKGVGGRIVPHWFWDSKENGWWEDEFVIPGLQPTSVAILDGDKPDDRVVAIGCEDGFVRFEDPTAKNDGGHRIVSSLVFGPLVPGDVSGRVRFSHAEATLSSFGDSATVEFFTDDVADVIAGTDARYKGTAGPGYRGYNMFQAAGNQAWLKLGNAAAGEAWSLESLYIRAKQVGARRRT